MVHFVGAGSGAKDLITVRGAKLLSEADVIIYAGSLINPELLEYAKLDAQMHNSARMTLELVIQVMRQAEEKNLTTVRLHTGDSSIYGAVREQFEALDALGIPYEVCPGVSSFCGAAAALKTEYTLPGVSQTVIISRMSGRTLVPEKENLASLASHQASMVLFLSAGLLEETQRELLKGGYSPDTPAAIVYKATWPDEQVHHCTIATLAQTAREQGISNLALILVGDFLGDSYERSQLYNPSFSTAYRKADAL